MIEEGFVRLYADEFRTLAARAETGVDVSSLLDKRIGEARRHADLMDVRKGGGHLSGVIDRLLQEAERPEIRFIRPTDDLAGAIARRRAFLTRVVESLCAPAPVEPAIIGRRGRSKIHEPGLRER